MPEIARINISSAGARNQIAKQISQHGLILLEGISTPTQLVKLAKTFGTVIRHPDSPSALGTALRNLGMQSEQRLGFTNLTMGLHTDRSCLEYPPDLIFFFLRKAGKHGGASVFCDGRALVRTLRKRRPQLIARLSESAAISVQSENRTVSFPIIAHRSGRCAIRFRFDDKSFYNSRMIEFLPSFFEELKRLMFTISLRTGEGYILNNGHWLHGRTAFTGNRVGYRILIKCAKTSLKNDGIAHGFED